MDGLKIFIKEANKMKNTQDLVQKVKELEKENKKLERLAYQDVKFGCYNRNWLNVYKNKLRNEPLTISLFDINGLKKINDTKGHNAGDKYIKTVIDVIKSTMQKLDYCCDFKLIRLGGDEFLLIHHCHIDTIAIELRKALQDRASVGHCYKTEKETVYSAMKTADRRMYNNKEKFYQDKKALDF